MRRRYRSRRRDHPRSRGVYVHLIGLIAGYLGSSPLARGLQSARPRRPRAGGIIPARAGFTRRGGGWRGAAADHPRSRGVYATSDQRYPQLGGSSPLARGLHVERQARAVGLRIIPARAGFTPASAASTPPSPDHPRSRGVYISGACAQPISRGSSPLARGLLRGPRAVSERLGIIPARAGFTTGSRGREGSTSDHPRSRGVYQIADWQSHSPGGSSPLARGLRRHEVDGDVLGRIIPARAGFTGAPHVRPCLPRDHPRSRGVYTERTATMLRFVGSSPLARGLHDPQPVLVLDHGIIPARAGFTREYRAR